VVKTLPDSARRWMPTLMIVTQHEQMDLESLHREFVTASREQGKAIEEWDRLFLPIKPLSANGEDQGFTAEQDAAQRRLIAADKRFRAASDAYWPALRSQN